LCLYVCGIQVNFFAILFYNSVMVFMLRRIPRVVRLQRWPSFATWAVVGATIACLAAYIAAVSVRIRPPPHTHTRTHTAQTIACCPIIAQTPRQLLSCAHTVLDLLRRLYSFLQVLDLISCVLPFLSACPQVS
jgi:hypothetical protein